MINKSKKYAWTVKVGEKGQILIPKEARDVFSIKPGDNLILLGDEDRGIAIVSNDDFLHLANKIFNAQKGEDNE